MTHPLIRFAGDSNLDQYATDAQKFSTLVGSGLGYPFVSTSGVSGNKSSQLLARLDADVIAQHPQVAPIMIGTNNAAWAHENDIPNGTMISSYLADIDEMTDRLQTAGVIPAFITPPPSRVPEVCLRMTALLAGLKDICALNGVAFIDIYSRIVSGLDTSNAFFTGLYRPDPDKYHLSVAGHAFVAGCLDWAAYLPPPVIPALGVVLTAVHNGSFGNVTGGTFRVAIPLVLPAPVTLARLTFQGHPDEPLSLNKVFAGPRSSGAGSASLAPVRVGGSTAFTVPQGGTLVSDVFLFSGGDMLVTGFGNAGASADRLSAKTSVAGVTTYYKNGDEAATLAPAGFLPYAGYLSLVSGVETD